MVDESKPLADMTLAELRQHAINIGMSTATKLTDPQELRRAIARYEWARSDD